MDICVIMVNYNNSKLSCDCCISLLDQQRENNLDIIIVDNNSKKEEKDLLNQFVRNYNNVKSLFLNDNIGYFPAMEKGQRLAYSTGINYDYMIVANNDLIYENDFLIELKKLGLKPDVMVVSPDIVRMDGVHQNPHFINPISPMRKFLYHFFYSNWYVALIMTSILRFFNAKRRDKDKPCFDKAQYIYMGFGACYILTQKYMQEVKFLDTRSFLMGEEQLLTIQIKKHGGKIYYTPNLKVHHMDSATFKQKPNRFAYECERKSYKLYKDFI